MLVVARDKNNRLALFAEKPYRLGTHWQVVESFNYMELDPTLFPGLKWEDEPLEIKLVEATNASR